MYLGVVVRMVVRIPRGREARKGPRASRGELYWALLAGRDLGLPLTDHVGAVALVTCPREKSSGCGMRTRIWVTMILSHRKRVLAGVARCHYSWKLWVSVSPPAASVPVSWRSADGQRGRNAAERLWAVWADLGEIDANRWAVLARQSQRKIYGGHVLARVPVHPQRNGRPRTEVVFRGEELRPSTTSHKMLVQRNSYHHDPAASVHPDLHRRTTPPDSSLPSPVRLWRSARTTTVDY